MTKRNAFQNRLLPLLAALVLTASLAACNSEPSSSDDSIISNPIDTSLSSSSSSGNSSSDDGTPNSEAGDLVDAKSVREQLADAVKENVDVRGWLSITNTEINEPTVQFSDNEYYMRRDYLGNPGQYYGCYFIDYRNNVTSRANLDRNTIIYGHNVGNPPNEKDDPEGPKFAQLLKFNDVEFAKQNPYITYTTQDDVMVFEIFAAFYTDTNFYYIDNAPNDSDYATLIKEAKLRSTNTYDVTPTTSDKILTLSTCTYKYGSRTDQRYVVMGRLLPANAELKETANVSVNPSPKEPQF